MTDEVELLKDVCEALRFQVMQQNEEISRYRGFIRELRKTPHQWLRDEIDEVLG